MSNGNLPEPDDFFAETRMSFGDHIEELRVHLFRAIYGFIIALVASFFVGAYVLDFIVAPVKQQLTRYYQRRAEQILKDLDRNPLLEPLKRQTGFAKMTFYRPQLAALLAGKPSAEIEEFKRPVLRDAPAAEAPGMLDRVLGRAAPKAPLVGENEVPAAPDDLITLYVSHREPTREVAHLLEFIRNVGQFDDPTTLSPMEAFMVYFKVCLLCALVIGSPWIFYQIWSFVAAGLYPHEKKLVNVYLPFSLGLFLAGVFLCQFLVIPKALETFLWFNEWLGLKPDMRLNEWLSFAILLPVIFGISFQTPMVMLFLDRLGIMGAEQFKGHRKIVIMVMAVFAAIITPTPDAFTMLLLLGPMYMLFELGIILIRMSPRSEFEEEPEPEEMVGV
jgi:sec-independent protein translocase protein TatC